MHNITTEDLEKIRSYEGLLKKHAKKLNEIDPNDEYWQMLSDDKSLVRDGKFIESNMVTSWIAAERKPKRILEIGTRTGGSLIALLSVYNEQEYKEIEEIVSFDMWREYVSTTWFSTFVSGFSGKKSKFNLSFFAKVFGNLAERKSIGKVKRNLGVFNLKSDKITFVSGDSKVTVPEYFKEHPGKKFDYILVDGGHDDHTALCDLENVVNYADKGGVILFDDIMPESYNLIGVWNKFKENHADDFTFHELYHRKGIAWAVKK